ncbi:hypothetical protein [Bosea rubneri]|uniref:Uncharacterized protein n=1 Tax=Bosea rubneri TaxID=3075434 RepID=A0ABU3SGJ4_9HYPH|nr:hypothetical protein [Bosea sp. ZW T0_25]MDU0343891.1 hypothetical protein [Bosea sp. ZW T0_25]
MSIAYVRKIKSFGERQAAVQRAAQLINAAMDAGAEREFQLLFDAILEFDIAEAKMPVEIPLGFMYFLRSARHASFKGLRDKQDEVSIYRLE